MVRSPGAQDNARQSESDDYNDFPTIPAFVFLRWTGFPTADNRQGDTCEPEWGGDSTDGNGVVARRGERGSGAKEPKEDHPPPLGRDREPTSETVNRHAHQPFPD